MIHGRKTCYTDLAYAIHACTREFAIHVLGGGCRHDGRRGLCQVDGGFESNMQSREHLQHTSAQYLPSQASLVQEAKPSTVTKTTCGMVQTPITWLDIATSNSLHLK